MRRKGRRPAIGYLCGVGRPALNGGRETRAQRVWSCVEERLPADSTDAFDVIEVRILADDFQGVLPGEGSDPEVVVWNWPTLLFEVVPNYGIKVRCFAIWE